MAGENVCEGIVCACECPLQTYNLCLSTIYVYISVCVYMYICRYVHTYISYISFPYEDIVAFFFLDVHVLSSLRHQTNRSSESRMMLPMCGMRPFFCSTDIY